MMTIFNQCMNKITIICTKHHWFKPATVNIKFIQIIFCKNIILVNNNRCDNICFFKLWHHWSGEENARLYCIVMTIFWSNFNRQINLWFVFINSKQLLYHTIFIATNIYQFIIGIIFFCR